MISQKKQSLLLILSLSSFCVSAQSGSLYKSEIEIQATGTTNEVVPFWMRSNQFGSIPLTGISTSIIGRTSREYKIPDGTASKLTDWGFGFNARANAGKKLDLTIIEAYVKTRLGIFQLKAGRSRDVMGLNGDTSLSSGNFAVSGNSLGIPKIDISIPEYWRLPILNGLFSIKGNFSHGWIGETKIIDNFKNKEGVVILTVKDNFPKSYLHQKSAYIKLGKRDWKLNLIGGFNHQVFWDNQKDTYGDIYTLSGLQTFLYVIMGKSYGNNTIPSSKIGNQLGSIDMALEYNFKNILLSVYRQNVYDVGALSKLANIADGLNGISLTNKLYDRNNNGLQWKNLLLEVFYTKNQAGYPWSRKTKSGDEDYYNNYYFKDGWSYHGLGLGNPLITKKTDAQAGQASQEFDYFINNRVVALHTGFKFGFNSWEITEKSTYSINYGTFGTSIFGKTTGNVEAVPDLNKIYKSTKQFSILIEGTKTLRNGLTAGIVTAYDNGKLLNPSFATQIKLIKKLH